MAADISVGIVLDDAQYNRQIANAEKSASKFGQSLSAAGNAGKTALTNIGNGADFVKNKMESLGSVIVGVGLVEFLSSSLEGASKMVELANSIGVTTQSMMEMQIAGAAAGKSGEDIAGMIQKMNLAAQDANDGNLKLRNSFADLNITMDDLRQMSPDQAFAKIAKELSNMEDPARRASIATELLGKAARITDWKDLQGNLEKYAGTQRDAAAATESAKNVLDNLAVKTQEVRNQFVLLLDPILQWIDPFIQGTDGAKKAATGLAIVMGTFATAGTVVAINATKDAFIGLAGAFGIGSAAATSEATSLAANTAATQANSASKLQGLAAKVASYEASIAEAQANVTNATTSAEAATANAVLERTTWRLVTAKAALAEATAGASAVTAASTAITSGSTVATGTAAVATTGFAGAMATLRTAVVSTLGPIGAFVAAAGSLYAVWQATFGEEHGIFSETGDQSGANFISDFFGITDSTEDELKAKTKQMTDEILKQQEELQKKLQAKVEETNVPSVLNPSDKTLDPSAAAAQGVKNQTATLMLNNELAAKRLQLEISLAGAAESTRSAALAGFDQEAKLRTDVLRIEGEIKRLRIDEANSREAGKNSTQIAELEKQKQLLIDQNVEMAKLKGQLIEAQDAQKMLTFYMEDQLKVSKEVADIRLATDELTMTNDEKKLNNIKKQVNAQIEGAIKLRELQLGRKLTPDEIAPISDTINKNWEPVRQATQDMIDKSRTFETGWTQAWKAYADEATNAANRGKEVFEIMTTAAEDAFDKLIGDSDATWKEIFDNAVKQMMKSDFKNLLGQLLNSSQGGSSGGGFFQNIAKFFAGGFANGGFIPAGGYGITGENGPEYVSGPAQITPIPQGGGDTYQVTINALDAKSVQQLLSQHSELIYGLSLKGQRAIGV